MSVTLNAGKAQAPQTSESRLMGTGLIIGLILIGLFSFSALITLLGYAGDMQDKNNGQAHVLSNSAIGFAGLRILLEESGNSVTLDPEEPKRFDNGALRIITLNSAYQADSLNELRPNLPKLIILPKWNVMPIAKTPGWVQSSSAKPLQASGNLTSTLEDLLGEVKIQRALAIEKTLETAPYILPTTTLSYDLSIARQQTLSSETLESLMSDNNGNIILGRIPDTQTYILSDPDFLNTQGLVKKSGARFAVDLLSYIQMKSDTEGYVFDLSVHGLGGRQNMIKLFTQPPFLSVTLLLIAFVALLGWQAFIRFGDPHQGHVEALGKDLQMGPQSLAKTTADFLAITERESHLMQAYACQTRQQALKALNFPGRDMTDHQRALDRREVSQKIKPTFETLYQNAKTVTQRDEVLRVATALQKWKKDITS